MADIDDADIGLFAREQRPDPHARWGIEDVRYSLTLRADESKLIAEGELLDAQAQMTPEQYAQEYPCSFDAAILGAY